MDFNFERIVLQTMRKHKMLENVQKIVVGFSGGADSASLLWFLAKIAKLDDFNFEFVAAHVNHNLRGDEALRDQTFAEQFCKNLGVKLFVKSVNVSEIAQQKKIGLEEAGRLARYEFLNEIADEVDSKIAVAHTLSDNCETMILNMIRGAGLSGMCGIPPIRDKIIRPLIETGRQQVEEYCEQNSIKYINDSTNFAKDYTRNKIRLDIIPYIKSINPNFESTVNRLADILSYDKKYLDELSDNALNDIKMDDKYNAEKLKLMPEALKSRVVFKILKNVLRKQPENRHIQLLKSIIDKGGKIAVSKDVSFCCNQGLLSIEKNNKCQKFDFVYPLKLGRIALTEIKTNIIIKVEPFSEYKQHPEANVVVLDYDKVAAKSVFRTRRPGDIISLKKRNVTKTLKKLFNELKIPANKRDAVLVLADESEVIWADNIAVSPRYALAPDTEKVLIIKKEKCN